MKHQNILLLEKIYSHFAEGDFPAALELCADSITFQVPGKSKLAGKHTKANFAQELMLKVMELSDGTYKLETHDIMSSDIHATVLASSKVTRGGKTVELRTVHVWRFENGKPIAWYEYPRDLYAFDALWS